MNEKKVAKSWWKRRWLRVLILLVLFVIVFQLEQYPSSNPFGANIVVINAILGIWIWAELLIGLVKGVVWVAKKMLRKEG
jgi:hypothetical protein